MSEEEDGPKQRDVRNPSASTRNVVHWVTHARGKGLGMWAWLLHRITGIMLLGIISLHILKNQFGIHVPGGRLVTIDLLIIPGAYHALNGVRVILVEAFDWATVNEDRLFIGVLGPTLIFLAHWFVVVGL